MATSVITNPIIGGGVDYYKYDYSNDRKISSLVSYMQTNGYRFAMASKLSISNYIGTTSSSSSQCAQRIFTIEELEYINTQNTNYETGICIPAASVNSEYNKYNISNTLVSFCGTKGDKLISTDITIYLF